MGDHERHGQLLCVAVLFRMVVGIIILVCWYGLTSGGGHNHRSNPAPAYVTMMALIRAWVFAALWTFSVSTAHEGKTGFLVTASKR